MNAISIFFNGEKCGVSVYNNRIMKLENTFMWMEYY